MTEKKIICRNKKALMNYVIEDKLEAGIALKGSEVKSLRAGMADLSDAYAKFEGGELYLINAHIAPYSHSSFFNHQPRRSRKLLLHKKEIKKWSGKVERRGLTIIPLCIYFIKGIAKVELALVRGKKTIDKREDIKKKDEERSEQKSRKGKNWV